MPTDLVSPGVYSVVTVNVCVFYFNDIKHAR